MASKHCFLESQQFVVVCCSYDRTSTNSFKDCTFHCQLYLATNIEWIEHFTATLSTDIRTQHPDTATSQETDLAKLAAHAHASWKLQWIHGGLNRGCIWLCCPFIYRQKNTRFTRTTISCSHHYRQCNLNKDLKYFTHLTHCCINAQHSSRVRSKHIATPAGSQRTLLLCFQLHTNLQDQNSHVKCTIHTRHKSAFWNNEFGWSCGGSFVYISLAMFFLHVQYLQVAGGRKKKKTLSVQL